MTFIYKDCFQKDGLAYGKPICSIEANDILEADEKFKQGNPDFVKKGNIAGQVSVEKLKS